MIKSKNLLLICALSFFILNVGYSVYFFKIQNILSIFKIEEKINYFEDLKIYFPDISISLTIMRIAYISALLFDCILPGRGVDASKIGCLLGFK